MAADVSSLVRILSGYKEEQMKSSEGSGGKPKVLITRDLLGGCSSKLGSTELDLDLQVPNGWEKRLDLKSGKIYLQRCNSPNSSSSSEYKHQQQNRTVPGLQDLNFPPSSTSSTANHFPPSSTSNLLEDTSLDLKLNPAYDYQSVCTLDKVKSALERAEKESVKKRSRSTDGSSSSPVRCSLSSPSIRDEDETDDEKRLFAAGCPGCLLYVLISKRNPKCPRCDSVVPSPVLKKPRIDLNAAA
ncbi:PREDICTED: uncharacterized protein LOC104590351 [Nelumbo nucifera]|uniref:GIR1-like zinc ribbon domain-containing protein n=2 Tax=Nelumbo nucifera TaxID=4432 RepID=A0A822ZKX8_NELNU|nr:PREDICTED: uncharacterized protein LOC104590351 [Nelumbo nucifera]DAD43646.1 TPA_asm: hypothetical protein HUJ06_001876 [Nelumbo nucifera]